MRAVEDEFVDQICTPQFRRYAIYRVKAIIPADHWSEAEDVVQTALLRMWIGLPGFRGDSSLKTWSERVVERAALFFRRSVSRQPDFVFLEPTESDLSAVVVYCSHTGRPIRYFGEAETTTILAEVMRLFPAHYHTVLEMRADGKTFAQIASENDYTEYQAKKAFHTAMSVIRENLQAGRLA